VERRPIGRVIATGRIEEAVRPEEFFECLSLGLWASNRSRYSTTSAGPVGLKVASADAWLAVAVRNRVYSGELGPETDG